MLVVHTVDVGSNARGLSHVAFHNQGFLATKNPPPADPSPCPLHLYYRAKPGVQTSNRSLAALLPMRVADLSAPSLSAPVEGVQSTLLLDANSSSPCEPTEPSDASAADVCLADVPVNAPAPKRVRGPQ